MENKKTKDRSRIRFKGATYTIVPTFNPFPPIRVNGEVYVIEAQWLQTDQSGGLVILKNAYNKAKTGLGNLVTHLNTAVKDAIVKKAQEAGEEHADEFARAEKARQALLDRTLANVYKALEGFPADRLKKDSLENPAMIRAVAEAKQAALRHLGDKAAAMNDKLLKDFDVLGTMDKSTGVDLSKGALPAAMSILDSIFSLFDAARQEYQAEKGG